MGVSVLWFRRDLRLGDHPALRAAVAAGDEVLPLFVLDPALRGPAGTARLLFLSGCLRALDEDVGGRLVVRAGPPERVVPDVVRAARATSVHVSADFGPYGAARDARVERALGDVPLVRTGSPYAVPPGALRKADGSGYLVFSAFYRHWREHGWPAPVRGPRQVRWSRRVRGEGVPSGPRAPAGLRLPEAGEAAARRRWAEFRSGGLARYADLRDRPAVDGTSRLSPYLHWGCVHPRTLLADLARRGGGGDAAGAEEYRRQLAWREFYADVLFHHPDSARENLRAQLDRMRWDEGPAADVLFEAWAAGRTGYPVVDAGMRQLRHEGWMHNRVRMVTASFLVKDLHVHWRRGARFFMDWLVDGDLASNQHGWQWVAGSGSDPSPFTRVFNPVLQGHRYDPAGEYVRRYVPELRGLSGRAVHEPWTLPDGPPAGYPSRVVDHAEEGEEAKRRYHAARGSHPRR
jgi:deoxyribodipyrimidine photo-lyase